MIVETSAMYYYTATTDLIFSVFLQMCEDDDIYIVEVPDELRKRSFFEHAPPAALILSAPLMQA